LCFADSDVKRETFIDVSEFSHGIYTINIVNNIRSYISRLVIE